MAHDCLSKHLKSKVLNNPNKYVVITVVSDRSYYKAERKLDRQIPTVGFLQEIQIEQTKIRINKYYRESMRQSKRLKANIGIWMKYQCKYKDKYYVTILIPKAEIDYIGFDRPQSWNLKELYRLCRPYGKVVLLLSDHYNLNYKADLVYRTILNIIKYDYWSREKRGFYNHWRILCGNAEWTGPKAFSSWSFKKENNQDQNFLVIGYRTGTGGGIRKDLTLDFWLELTKEW